MLLVIICAALAATLSVASSLNMDCTEPPAYPHAKLEKTSVSHGSFATYIFQDPFKLLGNLRVQCLFGEWKYRPNCEDGRCYVKDLTDSSHISLEETPLYVDSGKSLPVICEPGYSPVDSTPSCQDGEWTRNSQPPCQTGLSGVRAKSPRITPTEKPSVNVEKGATAVSIDDNNEDTVAARCSPLKCDIPCQINFNAKPCPACQCGPIIIGEQCSLPKCEDGCPIDFEAKPCPVCECDKSGCPEEDPFDKYSSRDRGRTIAALIKVFCEDFDYVWIGKFIRSPEKLGNGFFNYSFEIDEVVKPGIEKKENIQGETRTLLIHEDCMRLFIQVQYLIAGKDGGAYRNATGEAWYKYELDKTSAVYLHVRDAEDTRLRRALDRAVRSLNERGCDL